MVLDKKTKFRGLIKRRVSEMGDHTKGNKKYNGTKKVEKTCFV